MIYRIQLQNYRQEVKALGSRLLLCHLDEYFSSPGFLERHRWFETR